MTWQHCTAFWMTVATFVYHSMFGSSASETNSTPQIKKVSLPFLHWGSQIKKVSLPFLHCGSQIKKVSLPFLHCGSLWFFRNFFSVLSLFILSWCSVLLSSTSYLTAIFMLAFTHPGLEIRIQVLYSINTVKYTKAQRLVEDAHTWQYLPDTNLIDWTCEGTFASLKVHNLKVPMQGTYFVSIPFSC